MLKIKIGKGVLNSYFFLGIWHIGRSGLRHSGSFGCLTAPSVAVC